MRLPSLCFLIIWRLPLHQEIQSCTVPSFMASSAHGGSGTGMLSIIFRVGGVIALNSVLISLLAVMRENQALCKAAELSLGIDLSSVQPLQQEIVEAYGDSISDPRTLLSILRTNKAYEGIPLPLIREGRSDTFIFDKNHRVFREDIGCGLSLLVLIGQRLKVPTPYIEEIYYWCCEYMGGKIARSPIPADWPTIRRE